MLFAAWDEAFSPIIHVNVLGRIQTLVKMKNVPLSQQAQITMHAMATMIPHWILKYEKF